MDCTELKYSSEFLAKYPTAPAGCLKGRIHEGKKYGKFTAKVYLSNPDFTTVELLNVKGDPLTTFSFKPGEKISFRVSEDRMTASEKPGSTEESWAVLPPTKK